MSGRMVSADEARKFRDEATEGPWRWRNTNGDPMLLGARTRVAMAFRRMGMNGAQPMFSKTPRELVLLDDAGRENLNGFPDARLIAAAPDLAHTVVQQAEQIAAVLALHNVQAAPLAGGGRGTYCDECSNIRGDYAPWPCPTALALGVTA